MYAKLFTAVVVLSVLMASSSAIAQRGRGGPGQGMGRGMQASCGLGLGLGLGPAVMSDLKLTQEQTAKLQKISDMFLAETQSHRSVLQSKLTELATLWTAESPNEALIRAKVAEVDSVRAKIRNAMIDRTFSVMNVLTADQKAKMRSAVSSQQSTAVDFGYGLGFGCAMNGGGCYMMGVPAGQGGGRRRL